MFERVAPEQHDTLPDIPEPAENPCLVDHQYTRDMLAQAYRSGKMHHAILLAGPQGIGKATLAFHLAHHIFTHPDPVNAPEEMAPIDSASQSFRLVAQGAHPGLLHLSRPRNDRDKKFKTVITVDEIRRVSRFLGMTTQEGGYRVILVDPADDMNTNAANALLKNLEEPPRRTLFILTTHSLGRLLPTIRSRCQTIKLQPLGEASLYKVLQNIGAEIPSDAGERSLLAARASGSARTAILLTQFGGLEIEQALNDLLSRKRLNMSDVFRLADAASGKDRQIQFSLFNRLALDRISDNARMAAEAGDLRVAASMTALHEDLRSQLFETETFNLDKRQHVVGTITTLHSRLAAQNG